MRKFNNKSNFLGTMIKEKRLIMDLSQNDVCKLLLAKNITISRSEMCLIEKGRRMLKDFEMLAICDVLDIKFENVMKEFEKRMNRGGIKNV